MSEKTKRFISVRQVVLLIIGFSIGGGILALPNGAARAMGSGGWLWVFGIGLVVVINGLITAALVRIFPEDTAIEFSQKLLGKPLGFVLGFLFVLFFFLVIPIETRILQELVNISILPQASTWFVSGLFLATLAYAVSQGVKSMVYVNELLMEIALVVGLSVTFLAWQHFDPIHLFPLLDEVRFNLEHFREELGMAFIYTGFPVILFLLPYFKSPQKIAKATVIGTAILTLTYTFFTLTVLGVFGYKEVLNLSFPGLELAKSVNLETVILERLDLVLVVSWISAIFTTCLVSYFLTVLGLSKLLGIKKQAYISWALLPITYYVSTLFTNYFAWRKWNTYLGIFSIFISLILPAALLVVALIRRKTLQAGK